MRLILFLIVWLSLGIGAASAQPAMTPVQSTASGPQSTARIEAELVPMSAWAVPGSTAIVAIRQQIEPGWHTYWRNPGDSGGATTLDWSRTPAGVVPGGILWPTPHRQRLQGLVNYGYEGQVFLPVPIQIPADARPGVAIPLVVRALFLVCSDEMCVPDELTLRLDLPVAAGAPPLAPAFGQAIRSVVEAAPRPAGITATVSLTPGGLVLSAQGGPLAGARPTRATFFPFDPAVMDHGDPLSAESGPNGLTLTLQPTRGLLSAGLTAPISGVLETDVGTWEVVANPGPPLSGTSGGETLSVTETPAAGAVDWGAFAQAALFALLGGLILNLMPCVFPILAMKAASLAAGAHDAKEARRDGLAFLAGVEVTFLILAGALLGLRAAGESVGWGFQLQSPSVTGGLALLMLAVGLNLSGVFQVGGALQGVAFSRRFGASGAFLTGVLAVVVAAPCTAPFMAAALGAALLLTPVMALAVFLMLGLGLALPYVAVSLSPGLLRRFPRPGPWMERLKGLLAFPMYGAALWLAWVFSRQAGGDALALLLGAVLGVALAAWLAGQAQDERANGRRGLIAVVGAGLAILATAGLLFAAGSAPPRADVGSESAGGLPSQPWSPQAVAAARDEGRTVLVNFTADWCVTCKINERTSLGSARTAAAMTEANAVYLVADWTSRDDAITRELERHGRSGVPLYLVYAPGQTEPRILPQLLTEGVVIDALETPRP